MLSADQWLELRCKAFILTQFFTSLRQLGHPHFRELVIQCDKLGRILEGYPETKSGQAGWSLLADKASLKKRKKEWGKKTVAIHQQLRKVNLMTKAACKEWLRKSNPSMKNAEFQVWLTDFHTGMEESSREIMRQVQARARAASRIPPANRGRLGSKNK